MEFDILESGESMTINIFSQNYKNPSIYPILKYISNIHTFNDKEVKSNIKIKELKKKYF